MNQKKILIVDGYNVINDWEKLSAIGAENLGTARDMLVEELSEYGSFTGTSIEIVFDAYRNKSRIERMQVVDNVQVFYTKIHQTADSYIEKRTVELTSSRKNVVFVATSDGAEQQFISGKGAYRISSRELRLEIDRTKKKLDSKIERNERTASSIGDVLDKKIVDALGKWR
ncbi:MAG: NYN domain-containing protein [Peptostreptococcaceae bacterium]|nr:NYN domain-containing protein [Peptostreptococcaceae bacterium]